MSPLKARLLTASILIPLFIVIILYASPMIFSIISGAIIILAFWEWTRLAGFITPGRRVLALFTVPILLLGAFAVIQNISTHSLNQWTHLDKIRLFLNWSVLGFWVLASIAVTIYPKGKELYQNPLINLLLGIFVLLPPWLCAIALQAISPRWLIYPLVLIYSADSAAYFIGKKWGRTHFSPKLSPGKTSEGVGAAFLATLVIASLGFFVLKIQIPFFNWFLLNFMTVLFSIVGDLFESLFKRQQNLKDSGSLLPGHGGILDRVDSVTAALPIFAIGLMY